MTDEEAPRGATPVGGIGSGSGDGGDARSGEESPVPSSRTWLYALSGVTAVVIGVVAVLVGASNSRATVATVEPITTTTVATPAPPGPVCPLTGTPAPGGAVPTRPALGVKIGNYTADRPSAGLNQADVVFEEPVEGAITRLLAVFQCQGSPLVGDTRSAREPDVGILSQLSDPLYAHAGGIDPVINLLQQAALIDENLFTGGRSSAIIAQPGRVAPYAMFVNTSSLWAFDRSDTTPPAPIFQYSTMLPAGSVPGSGASAHIPFSGTSDVTWTWNPAGQNYLRSYAGTPDRMVNGPQTAATNVVIMTVQTSIGPWVENAQGAREVDVAALGTGPLLVIRNGVAITGTWSRSSLTQPATLTAANGVAITLQPGNTWEELVPAGIAVTTTSSTTTTSTG